MATKNDGNLMKVGGGQDHNQGAGAGEFIGGKFTYIKIAAAGGSEDLTAHLGADGGVSKIVEHLATRATVVVVNVTAAVTSIIVEANSGWGNAADQTSKAALDDAALLASLKAMATHDTVNFNTAITAVTITDGLVLA
tara:strand:+ start:896 stop:1309 length:414 start_codon:yes stop_codon:yes gene_type:complete